MRYLAVVISLIFLSVPALAQSVRITKVKVIDESQENNSSNGVQVDLQRGVCLDDPDNPTTEPFTDSIVKLTVLNRSNELIRFHSFSFVIERRGGSQTTIRSRALAPISGFYIARNETADVSALFLDALTSGAKQAFGSSVLNSGDYGFRNVRFILQGTTSKRRKVKISTRQAISFDNFDRCKK